MPEPRERPILYQTDMVRALLREESPKTQTRRVVKHYGTSNVRRVSGPCSRLGDFDFIFPDERDPSKDGIGHMVKCPYGVPGDRLWVRERHCFLDVTKSALSKFPLGPENNNEVGPDVWNLVIEYGDGSWHETSVEGEKPKQTRERGETGWRPGIHMPRWASRITLEITDVRVERLQDISEADARAEGLCSYRHEWRDPEYPLPDIAYEAFKGAPYRYSDPTQAYRDLWQSINGPGSWEANPWVWALTFRRVTP